MTEHRIETEDQISPLRITHHCEEIWNGNTLEQKYNYLVYEFETDQHRYRARAYLDDIHTVSIFGPFDKDASGVAQLEGIELDQRVVAYLRRRYREIERLGPAGYVPIK
jgi:hypothetical protein